MEDGGKNTSVEGKTEAVTTFTHGNHMQYQKYWAISDIYHSNWHSYIGFITTNHKHNL